MTVVRVTNPPITVRVGTPVAPRITSTATFVGSANLINQINYALSVAQNASDTANSAAANVNSKVTKTGDTMTGTLAFGNTATIAVTGNFTTSGNVSALELDGKLDGGTF
jgi:hypothetical protein